MFVFTIRFLLICVAVLGLPAIATAQSFPLTIQRVWTQDGVGNDKNSFAPGEAIRYATIITNAYSQPITMQISFKAAGPSWAIAGQQNPAFRQIYHYMKENVTVPPGDAAYYSPYTVPLDAQPGLYYVEITACLVNENGSNSCTRKAGGAQPGEEFHVPGLLASTINTFASDGITPAAVVNGVGAGEALFYEVTVTNTSYQGVHNTAVVLTDLLPQEIFDIIGVPTTDHGRCDKTGSWPSTTLTCLLGDLAPGETATVSFTASIMGRDPSGEPRPPERVVNMVDVRSDQQQRATSSYVETVVIPAELSCEDYEEITNAAAGCLGAVPVVGFPVAVFWALTGPQCHPTPDRQRLLQAVETGSKELLFQELGYISQRIGTGKLVETLTPKIECLTAWRNILF